MLPRNIKNDRMFKIVCWLIHMVCSPPCPGCQLIMDKPKHSQKDKKAQRLPCFYRTSNHASSSLETACQGHSYPYCCSCQVLCCAILGQHRWFIEKRESHSSWRLSPTLIPIVTTWKWLFWGVLMTIWEKRAILLGAYRSSKMFILVGLASPHFYF